MPIAPPKGRQPYAGTKVPVERSKAAITELLRTYGASGVEWTDNFETGQVSLKFAVSGDNGYVGYRITPAPFKSRHRTWDPLKGNVDVEAPDWSRSMRLLHAWLKTKLESIAFGLTAVEEEFLAQRIVTDQSGQETTAGVLVLGELERTGGHLAIGPPPASRKATVVEGEIVSEGGRHA